MLFARFAAFSSLTITVTLLQSATREESKQMLGSTSRLMRQSTAFLTFNPVNIRQSLNNLSKRLCKTLRQMTVIGWQT